MKFQNITHWNNNQKKKKKKNLYISEFFIDDVYGRTKHVACRLSMLIHILVRIVLMNIM